MGSVCPVISVGMGSQQCGASKNFHFMRGSMSGFKPSVRARLAAAVKSGLAVFAADHHQRPSIKASAVMQFEALENRTYFGGTPTTGLIISLPLVPPTTCPISPPIVSGALGAGRGAGASGMGPGF